MAQLKDKVAIITGAAAGMVAAEANLAQDKVRVNSFRPALI
jgi:NADP-dependent 3-hydroxy acid dehydrogenase YdfG